MDFFIVFFTEFLAPMIGQIIFDILIHFIPNNREEIKTVVMLILIILIFSLGVISGYLYPAILLKWPLLLLLNFIATPFIVAYLIIKCSDFMKKRDILILRYESYWFVYFSTLFFMIGRFAASYY